ncbi:two component transcriptional regulator, LuxR family [Caldicellulosiruptor hydrothermalis 108]|uniref:Two component transcriptional regulator, LuxR family n=1 Tax=Caldicellulosiruptor hydrothermalis (strain DSM 18901 / VKM B-2411 / 108) TaxID=632292 RepID=E4Q9V6_CALH1|nr:LuxR C-terminal-related transcriptional regulator [Caldicellulosiruptor hydrothermalis]ADQ08211.1 two component transcriptional regulator, LuxR family [Caldicellulosiruptor hydrothermalis 108]
MKKPTVLIVDDNPAVLDGLKIILELENFEVVSLCTNAKEAIEFLKMWHADVVLMDKVYSNKEIARMLFISEGTVRNYITSILQKLNLKNRTQIAVYYLTKFS